MNDRVLSALKGLGIGGTPVAALEREDAFFALLSDMLVYQDGQGTRRVTLRDLTRIHSDQEGLLRVETPAGTALTASLLGFDPAQVQPFFAQVRDATARAKNLPSAPLPTAGGPKTFGSAPRSSAPLNTAPPAQGPQVAAARTEEPPRPVPSVQAPSVQAELLQAPRPGTVREVRAVAAPGVTSPTPPGPTPVVPRPVDVSPAAPDPAPAPARVDGQLTALAARANAVHGLVSRLQLLAAVLGLAAVGLAVFQFLDEARLSGLWTLIAGGVGCIALLAFADVTRLIVALARAVAEGRAPGAGNT